MFIKDLELVGFKSFVDETKLVFESGITVIVGPNGCGKSNICDAMRWVFGEQSAKLLRGGKMDEVIFNGSETRKAVGFAEVSVTLSGLNGILTKPELSAYEEITVTRRLFRSGESEYSINKTNCRLKDIVDLFLDTGISTRSFSIMEQAQVNRLIISRPVERRYIIEEAAGVLKYKQRRNEAINKLESSQQNLLRISDIVRELESQMNSLKRQANKAERYKTYKSELREIGLALLSIEYKSLKDKQVESETEYESVKEKEIEASARYTEIKNNLELVRPRLLDSEKGFAEIRQVEFEAKNNIEQNEEKIKLLTSQVIDITEETRRKSVEFVSLKEESEKLAVKNVSSHSDIALLEDELKNKRALFYSSKETLSSSSEEILSLQTEISGLEKKIVHSMNEYTGKKNRLISIEARLDGIRGREERLDLEIEASENERKKSLSKIEIESGLITEAKEALLKKREELVKLAEERTAIRYQLKEAEEKSSELRKKVSEKKGLLESLQALKREFEGFGSGVKAVMNYKERGELTGVLNLLVDCIETAPEYEKAIEAALGEKLRGIVVDSLLTGLDASSLLKKNSAGKEVFIPLSIYIRSSTELLPESSPGFLGRASDMVTVKKEEYREIVSELLGSVLIFQTMEQGIALCKTSQNSFKLVTLEGEIIESNGIIIGGKEKGASKGLMAKNRQIEELQKEVKTIIEELTAIEERREALRLKSQEMEQQKQNMDFRVHELEVGCANRIRDCARLTEESERLKRKNETLSIEKEQFLNEKERLKFESETLAGELSHMEKTRDEFSSTLNLKKEELSNRRVLIDSKKEELNRSEVEITSLAGKLENLKSEIKQISLLKESLKGRIEGIERAISENRERMEVHKLTIETTREEISKLSEQKGHHERESVQLKESIEKERELLLITEKESKEKEVEVNNLREIVAEKGLKKSELQMRLEHLQQKGREDFGLENEIPICSEETIEEEKNRERLQFLKNEIERYGDVNLTAISEYETVKERYTFLKTQEEDLSKSIHSLHQTIQKIDLTTDKLFGETFEKINENFKIIFRRLFGGGKAELAITDSGEGKDAGVEIFVQPPGKKLQNITLMSAGEKAMTAISILFSVFMVRPSPFCLLDEIDAPLDDANIGRFKDMLGAMSHKTQFVIITHNQKTMSFADTLYGITMEEHGVSKVLSVNMREEEKIAISA